MNGIQFLFELRSTKEAEHIITGEWRRKNQLLRLERWLPTSWYGASKSQVWLVLGANYRSSSTSLERQGDAAYRQPMWRLARDRGRNHAKKSPEMGTDSGKGTQTKYTFSRWNRGRRPHLLTTSLEWSSGKIKKRGGKLKIRDVSTRIFGWKSALQTRAQVMETVERTGKNIFVSGIMRKTKELIHWVKRSTWLKMLGTVIAQKIIADPVLIDKSLGTSLRLNYVGLAITQSILAQSISTQIQLCMLSHSSIDSPRLTSTLIFLPCQSLQSKNWKRSWGCWTQLFVGVLWFLTCKQPKT